MLENNIDDRFCVVCWLLQSILDLKNNIKSHTSIIATFVKLDLESYTKMGYNFDDI